MTQPDRMSIAATDAAMAVSGLDYRLFFAADMEATRDQRSSYLVQAFQKWRAICEAMKALEDLAPTAAQRGSEAFERARDFAEVRRVAA